MSEHAVDPLPANIVRALDEGVRDLVVWLRAQGFETTDSGDGVSKPPVGRVFDVPHVFIRVAPDDLFSETARLVRAFAERGGEEPTIEATYRPADGVALVGLFFERLEA